MAKRKISKRLQAWMDDYQETFHGLEPCMGLDDLMAGNSTVAEYKNYNLRWITEHTQEEVRRLERK